MPIEIYKAGRSLQPRQLLLERHPRAPLLVHLGDQPGAGRPLPADRRKRPTPICWRVETRRTFDDPRVFETVVAVTRWEAGRVADVRLTRSTSERGTADPERTPRLASSPVARRILEHSSASRSPTGRRSRSRATWGSSGWRRRRRPGLPFREGPGGRPGDRLLFGSLPCAIGSPRPPGSPDAVPRICRSRRRGKGKSPSRRSLASPRAWVRAGPESSTHVNRGRPDEEREALRRPCRRRGPMRFWPPREAPAAWATCGRPTRSVTISSSPAQTRNPTEAAT